MNELNKGARQAALLTVLLQPARPFRGVFSRAWVDRHASGSIIEAGRWLVLIATTAACVAVIARQGSGIAIVMAAITMASLLSSIAGFAFSAICGAMLFHLLPDPVQVVQLMMTCSIANQAMMTLDVRRDVDWRGLAVYLANSVPGLMLGVWLLLHADRALYTRALGVFLVLYSAYMLVRRPVVIHRQHVAFDSAVGFVGGITGGAVGFPGAPVSIWCSMKGWNKARQRGIVQPFILILQIAALLTISLVRRPGSMGMGFDVSNLLFVPASLFGTALGLALYKRMSDIQFARAVNILLLLSGLSFVL